MNFSEILNAIKEAKEALQIADNYATNMAVVLEGRLRQVRSDRTLKLLKRELQDYNAATGKWKERA